MIDPVLGSIGVTGDSMQMSTFGSMQMSIIPKAGDPNTMELVVAAENRTGVIRMDLQKNEDITQFCKRMHSMLRGFLTAEVRPSTQIQGQAIPAGQPKSFEEVKAALTGQKPSAPVRA